jgi:hypothetical protein
MRPEIRLSHGTAPRRVPWDTLPGGGTNGTLGTDGTLGIAGTLNRLLAVSARRRQPQRHGESHPCEGGDPFVA